MKAIPPYTLTHLTQQIQALYGGKIVGVGSNDTQRQQNFLSKALAAYAVQNLAKCDVDQAAASIVDGSGDGGIDAIFFSVTNETLWLIQSKYVQSGEGEPELGDVSKFKDGVEHLVEARLDYFQRNPDFVRRRAQIEQWLVKGDLNVRAVLVYSSVRDCSPDRQMIFNPLRQRFCGDDVSRFTFDTFNLTSIEDWLTGADEAMGAAKVELTILRPGWITRPYETVYGQVRITDLVQLLETHGDNLVDANIRKYKGSTIVNGRILKTLQEEPNHFFYLNNGLTAFCSRLEIPAMDRVNSEQKRIRAFGFSIVNGAQTLGSIGELTRLGTHISPDAYAFIKVISLERCEDDIEFAQRITQSTNFQNKIEDRHFAALDENQRRLAELLALSGIRYDYKDGESWLEDAVDHFSLDEAALALACLSQDDTYELCAAAVQGPEALLDRTEIYDTEPRTRYQRVFDFDHSPIDARTVYRAVQVSRVLEQTLSEREGQVDELQRGFLKHARALTLRMLFIYFHPSTSEGLGLSQVEQDNIAQKAIVITDTMRSTVESMGYLKSSLARVTDGNTPQTKQIKEAFSDPTECRRVKNGTFSRLASQSN